MDCTSGPASQCPASRHLSPRLRRGGLDHQNLCPLGRSPQPASKTVFARLALVNARLLANKTFILNDFFTGRRLDFLLVTETWLNLGDLSPLSELIPPDCNYLNSPQTTAQGVGFFIKTVSTVSSWQRVLILALNCSCLKFSCPLWCCVHWCTDHRSTIRILSSTSLNSRQELCQGMAVF